jgi:hypothetical protein
MTLEVLRSAAHWFYASTYELEYWKAVLASLGTRKVPITGYVPRSRKSPPGMLNVDSAWKGIESILADLIDCFQIQTKRCLEFGVEFGYSTVALANFFDSVTGVDLFAGDKHTVNKNDIYDETATRLAPFKNIHLIRSDYREWIKHDNSSYDLIHVDIVHTYADTFACGLWSARHAQCVIFHDTDSFWAVKKAVVDIARETGKSVYNFRECNGLGILI